MVFVASRYIVSKLNFRSGEGIDEEKQSKGIGRMEACKQGPYCGLSSYKKCNISAKAEDQTFFSTKVFKVVDKGVLGGAEASIV